MESKVIEVSYKDPVSGNLVSGKMIETLHIIPRQLYFNTKYSIVQLHIGYVQYLINKSEKERLRKEQLEKERLESLKPVQEFQRWAGGKPYYRANQKYKKDKA